MLVDKVLIFMAELWSAEGTVPCSNNWWSIFLSLIRYLTFMFSLVVADTARCLSTSSRWDGEFSVYYVACRPTCNIHRNDGSTHMQCAYTVIYFSVVSLISLLWTGIVVVSMQSYLWAWYLFWAWRLTCESHISVVSLTCVSLASRISRESHISVVSLTSQSLASRITTISRESHISVMSLTSQSWVSHLSRESHCLSHLNH